MAKRTIEASIIVPVDVKEAFYTNLNEEREEQIESIKGNQIVVNAGANKIITIEVVVPNIIT